MPLTGGTGIGEKVVALVEVAGYQIRPAVTVVVGGGYAEGIDWQARPARGGGILEGSVSPICATAG